MPLLSANTELKETWGRNVIHVAMCQYACSLEGLPRQTQKGNDQTGEVNSAFLFPVTVLTSGPTSSSINPSEAPSVPLESCKKLLMKHSPWSFCCINKGPHMSKAWLLSPNTPKPGPVSSTHEQ